MSLLSIDKVNTFYGKSHVLFDVSLKVKKGDIVCLLGRNGAGKTTTLRSIIGLTPPKTGSVKFDSQNVAGWPPYKIARLGIGFVPEHRLIIPDLTVKENLELTAKRKGVWTLDGIYQLFNRLKEREDQKGGTLSGGEQQMLAIGRALMNNPDLVLLDEPSEGLAPAIVKMLAHFMLVLKEKGITTLVAEQNTTFALAFSDTAYVLEKGTICWKGACEELAAKPEVMKRYLGI